MTQNIEAQYISCLMHSPELLESVDISPDMLEGKTRKIFEAMQKLYDDARPIERMTVSSEAGVELDAIVAIYKTESSRALFTEYEAVIKNKYIAKKSREMASSFAMVETSAEFEELLKQASSFVTNEQIGVSDTAQILKAYEESLKNKVASGVMNPFTTLGEYVKRFYAGQYIIIGGRPSKGKSALLLSLLRRLSCNSGMVSLETSEAEIAARFIAQESKICLDIVANDVTQRQEERCNAMSNIYDKKMYFYDKSSLWRKVRAAMRVMVKRFDCKVIGIDYVQLMNMGEGRDRTEALGELSRELKEFARRNECTVIALAQLGRGADEGRPKLKDLQWSSQLEQDADVVMMIHEQDGKNTVQIEKNRDGRTGEVEMTFNKYCVDWEDLKW